MDLNWNWKRNYKKLKEIIKKVFDQLGDPYYQGAAATIAYFMFLSVLPMVILASQALGLFSLSIDTILNWAEINVSGSGLEMIQSLLRHRSTGTNNLILIIIVMWAASRANIYLIRLTNYTLFDGHIMGKGYIRDRFKSLITVFIAIAVITLSVVVLVYIPIFLNTAFDQNEVTKAIGDVWLALRWLVVLSLYFLVISVVFYSLPTGRVPYSEIGPGSIFTSIGLIVVSYLFNFYVNLSTNYDILYGSFANAVALIIWFWIMGWVMVIGIIFNRVWWDVRSENKIPIPEDVIARRSPLGFF